MFFVTVLPDEPSDDERMSQSDRQQVNDILSGLRDEVKEMDRSAWLYEIVREQVR